MTINTSAAEAIEPAVAGAPKPPPVNGEVHLLRRLGGLGTQNAPPQSREGGVQEGATDLPRSNSCSSVGSSKISSNPSSLATGDSYSEYESDQTEAVPLKKAVRNLVHTEKQNKTENEQQRCSPSETTPMWNAQMRFEQTKHDGGRDGTWFGMFNNGVEAADSKMRKHQREMIRTSPVMIWGGCEVQKSLMYALSQPSVEGGTHSTMNPYLNGTPQ